MNNIILSVIIPVFKVEKYIAKCMDSICSQPLFKSDCIELIVVNDGTPDSSMNVVGDYKKKYQKIRIINQQNQGLSMARNNGLELASGKYVWFVDSDDWLSEDAFSSVFSLLQKNEYDIISTLLNRVEETGGRMSKDVRSRHLIGKKIISGPNYLFEGGKYAPVQMFIYRRIFLIDNKLRFLKGIYHEDGQFNKRALYLAKEIYLCNNFIYNYLLRDNSIMHSKTMLNSEDLLIQYKTTMEFCDAYVKPVDKKYYRALCSDVLLISINWTISLSDTEPFKQFFKTNMGLLRRNVWHLLCGKHVDSHLAFRVLLFEIYPSLYIKWARAHLC